MACKEFTLKLVAELNHTYTKTPNGCGTPRTAAN